MTRKELKEKISEISNSEFPLIDFFNDIALNNNENFDKERAYEDIEKIYEVFSYYIDKCEQLENGNAKLKELVITWNKNGGKLLMENIKLQKIIEENFGYNENTKECFFKYNAPVMEEEIKEVLEDE